MMHVCIALTIFRLSVISCLLLIILVIVDQMVLNLALI